MQNSVVSTWDTLLIFQCFISRFWDRETERDREREREMEICIDNSNVLNIFWGLEKSIWNNQKKGYCLFKVEYFKIRLLFTPVLTNIFLMTALAKNIVYLSDLLALDKIIVAFNNLHNLKVPGVT